LETIIYSSILHCSIMPFSLIAYFELQTSRSSYFRLREKLKEEARQAFEQDRDEIVRQMNEQLAKTREELDTVRATLASDGDKALFNALFLRVINISLTYRFNPKSTKIVGAVVRLLIACLKYEFNTVESSC